MGGCNPPPMCVLGWENSMCGRGLKVPIILHLKLLCWRKCMLLDFVDVWCTSSVHISMIELFRFETAHCRILFNNTMEWYIQGGVISPILFNIMIDDIFSNVEEDISRAIYADDCSLWVQGRHLPQLISKLQIALNKVRQRTDRWGFVFFFPQMWSYDFSSIYEGTWVTKSWECPYIWPADSLCWKCEVPWSFTWFPDEPA